MICPTQGVTFSAAGAGAGSRLSASPGQEQQPSSRSVVPAAVQLCPRPCPVSAVSVVIPRGFITQGEAELDANLLASDPEAVLSSPVSSAQGWGGRAVAPWRKRRRRMRQLFHGATVAALSCCWLLCQVWRFLPCPSARSRDGTAVLLRGPRSPAPDGRCWPCPAEEQLCGC